jgi:hypothetical protein
MAETTRCRALSIAALALLLSACGTTPDSRKGPPPWGARRVVGFDDVSRPWIGPELRACRLQDWELVAGRVVCRETSPRFPLRTAMVQSVNLEGAHDRGREVSISVRTGLHGPREVPSGGASAAVTPSPAGPHQDEGWRGVILGAGDGERLGDLVHHRPARDGGLICAVDAHGRVAFFDMGADASVGGSWSVGGPLREGELPRLEAEARGPAMEGRTTLLVEEARLDVSLRRTGASWSVAALAWSPDGVLLSEAVLHDVDGDKLSGSLGLVSHRAAPDGRPFWFDDLSTEGDDALGFRGAHEDVVQFVQYTVSDGVLRLTAQFPPLGPDDPREATLAVVWRDRHPPLPPETYIFPPEFLGHAPIVPDAWTATFEVTPWQTDLDADLSLSYARAASPGTVRTRSSQHGPVADSSSYTIRVPAEPSEGEVVRIASLNCAKHYTGGLQWNDQALWFPHAATSAGVASAEPDLLVFAGDQLYEGDLDPVDARDEDTLILDYLTKWFRFGQSFGELTRRLPTVTIPDDHDVYHGNLWGAGGKRAVADKAAGLSAQDSGGYKHGSRFVNVVHRTQTSHLPRPADPEPVAQDISVYFTELRWGGVSFAVLADRQWKSSASVVVPAGQAVNGWFQAPGFDPRDADVPGAELLGKRQEEFLDRWATDWSGGVWAKVAVSQTPFVNVATLPDEAAGGAVLPSLPVPEPGAYPEGYRFAADTDSGGWPQTPRNRAVTSLRRGLAVHLAGDQHLGTLVEYGVDAPRDGGFAFTSPAIANTWPRRWWPPVWGERREDGAPHYTGDFEDGFGNALTVWAAANPVQRGIEPAALHDRAPGFGLVDLDPRARTLTFSCWPRGAAPLPSPEHAASGAPAPGITWWGVTETLSQYEGWPRTIHQLDNGPEAAGWIEVEVPGCDDPVFTVYDASGEVLYVWRAPASSARLPVPHDGPWSVKAWDEGRDLALTTLNLVPGGPVAAFDLDAVPAR